MRCVVSLFAVAVVWGASSLAAAERPNVLIILADDLGYGDVRAFHPSNPIETPHLDRLAAESLQLTDAHAPGSWCIPTRYSLLTGRYPIGVDVGDRGRSVIAGGETTLPATLKAAGYRTAMFGKWHLGHTAGEPDGKPNGERLEGGPVGRGFDSWLGIPRSLDQPPFYWIRDDRPEELPTETIGDANSKGWSPIQGRFWRGGGLAPGFSHLDVTPRLFDEAGADVLTSDDERPWLLYLALPSPHTPWVPTEEFAGKSAMPLYGDFLMQVDAGIGRILSALDDSGQAENTLVIVTSDNGPVWYESDTQKYGHAAAGPYRGMKGDAWEGGHRVPMLVRWPGRIEPRTSPALTCHADLLATLCGALDLAVPESAADSVDQSGHWLRNEPAPRDEMLQQSSRRFYSLRRGDWKYIPALGSGGFTKPSVREPENGEPAVQLYDLASDPGERTNLAGERPEQLAAMQARYAELMAGRNAQPQKTGGRRGR